jgi:hypothetical protein
MDEQPFMVRPPLELLRIYGNSLPALAQAAQEGRVTALEATLAAQKFRQLEAAGQSAQAPTQTVAEKLLGPTPPVPPMGGIGAPSPMPQPGVPAGLGATPEAAQMQAPMPAMPTEEAPMGMAEGGMVPPYASGGGLSQVPIPAGMFDEPNNGGYANGGIVAFAGGGWGSYFEDVATKAVPGLGVTSRQRTPAQNTAVGGVSNSFHQTGDARDFVPPKGMSMAAFHAKLKSEFGPQYDVINEGDHVHVEPGPGLAKSGQQLTNPAQAASPKTPMDVPGGSLTDQMMPSIERAGEFYDKFMPKPKTEARDKLKAHVEEGMSEEGQKKQKNYDKWSALAEAGWAIAGSNSPNFLQAVAEGGKVATASSKKAKEAREARFEKYLSQYAEIEGIENSEARERVKFMLDFSKTELDLKDKDLTRGTQWAIQKMEDATQNRNITVQSADTRRGQDFSLQASLASSGATQAAADKQERSLVWSSALEIAKTIPEYIEAVTNKDNATAQKIFNEVLAQQKASYGTMTGAAAAGAAPWERNYRGQ